MFIYAGPESLIQLENNLPVGTEDTGLDLESPEQNEDRNIRSR